MSVSYENKSKFQPIHMAMTPMGERRQNRRHDLEQRELIVQRWDSARQLGTEMGQIIDLSASGIKFRTAAAGFRADQHIRVRLDLPAYAGITPFFGSDMASGRTDWSGWLVVCRVQKGFDGQFEVAGRLMDMDEMTRGSLKLYLSTQPLAA